VYLCDYQKSSVSKLLLGEALMQKILDHMGVHFTSLQLRSQRNEILASNIANASTPNYKARDINFGSELQKQLREISNFDDASGKAEIDLQYRVPTELSLDGNTVELHVEQMEFAENVARYQASLSFLNQKISGLKSAIKGE
jgi:flagellar basal-body rod protein FlgB